MIKVLFVCLGNICRSPTADGVFRKLVKEARLDNRITVDSAGTAAWHTGKKPDERTIKAAAKRGFDLSVLRARQVEVEDFDEFDFILAMDNSNLSDLQKLKPAHFTGHLGLLLDFSAQSAYREVPDPYYGDGDGFELVLNLVEDAAQGLLQEILARSKN